MVADAGYLHRWIYVSCSAVSEDTTRVSVRYVTTALGPAGQKDIERYRRGVPEGLGRSGAGGARQAGRVGMGRSGQTKKIERVQTGIRFEKRTLKVLKALAEYLDLTLGDLMEGIVLHSFEGKAPFSKETVERIGQIKELYGLDLTAQDSHRLAE